MAAAEALGNSTAAAAARDADVDAEEDTVPYVPAEGPAATTT
jgi:hypothetical protein